MDKPKRTPVSREVKLVRKKWTQSDHQIVMGVDPGFSALGVVILERTNLGAKPKLIHAKVIETKKPKKKARTNLRVTNDDERRYREIWAKLDETYGEFDPYAVGVEGFRVYQGSGAKTMAVYGGVLFWAYTRNMYPAVFLPSDLKKRFAGKQSASKFAVEEEMYPLIDGFKATILGRDAKGKSLFPKTKREHIADAAGHAFLMLEEIDRTRQMLGL